MSVGKWNKFLSIREAAYLEVLLEVLASFEFNITKHNFDQVDSIHLQCLRKYHSLSLTMLTLFLCFH